MGFECIGYAYSDAGIGILLAWSGVLFGFSFYVETVFDVLWS